MPRTKEPKFKVGDVLERRNKFNYNVPAGSKGIVVYPVFFQDYENIEDIPEEDRDFPTVYWYDLVRREHIHPDEVKRCEGLRNKKKCGVCKDNELCSKLREVALCDISEFRRGKININVCKARKCKHVFFCGTRRLVQGTM